MPHNTHTAHLVVPNVRRFKLVLLAALLSAAAFVPQAGAQNPFAVARTNPPPVNATLRNEELIGAEAVKRAYLTAGTNEFAFVVPSEFRMDASNPEKIILVKSDYTCSMTVHVSSTRSVNSAAPKTETYRQALLDRYPGAKILNTFKQTVASRSGPAFDLQCPNGTGLTQFARVVFIPSPAGVIEFTLLTNFDKTADGQYAFNTVLLTFCSNQNGKLTIAPLYDKS